MSELKFPPLYLGCPVEVSSDPSRSDRAFGQVVEAKSQSADIVIMNSSGISVLSCWHISDPRCQEHKEVFQDPSRGVFDLTTGEKERRRIMKRLDGLEGTLAELMSRVMALESAPDERAAPQQPPQRRRGRPRKQSVLSG